MWFLEETWQHAQCPTTYHVGVLVSGLGPESGRMATNDRTRAFAQLKYRDPRVVLVDMRRAEATVAASDAPFAVKNLRTRELRPLRELREACTFCYGMTECTGQKFFVAHGGAGAIAPDQSRWAVWGNFLDDLQAREFSYPS